jgi:hypothetical protein
MRHSTAAMIQYEERLNRFPILLLKNVRKFVLPLLLQMSGRFFFRFFLCFTYDKKIGVEKTNI